MIPFKQFSAISEVQNISYGDTKDGKPIKDGSPYKHIHDEDSLKEYGAEHISNTPSGHKVYRYGYSGEASYHAVNPDTKKIDMSVSGKEKHGVIHKILVLAGEKNTIKAHTFIHHLITHHNKTMTVDKMSPGGKEVFKRLHDDHKDTVGIHGWHKGKPVNVDPSHEDMYGNKGAEEKSEKEEAATLLVAHKK